MNAYRCPTSCPVCAGTGVKYYRATISVGGEPAITFMYGAECPRGRGASLFLAAPGEMMMSTAEQLNQARRMWREMKAIESAQQRATSGQVRRELGRACDAAFDAIDPEYRDGRTEVASGGTVALALSPKHREADMFIAGVADGLLALIGCEP